MNFVNHDSFVPVRDHLPDTKRQRSGQHHGCEALEALRGSVEHKELGQDGTPAVAQKVIIILSFGGMMG